MEKKRKSDAERILLEIIKLLRNSPRAHLSLRPSKEESPSDVSHLIPFTFNLISLSLCKLLWVTDEDRSGGNGSRKAFNFPSLGRVLEIFLKRKCIRANLEFMLTVDTQKNCIIPTLVSCCVRDEF